MSHKNRHEKDTFRPKGKILLLQPHFDPAGGGPSIGAWMLHALHRKYQVTILTWSRSDIAANNRYYGTQIDVSRIKVLVVPPFLRLLVNIITPDQCNNLKYFVLIRYCKIVRRRYDLVMTANNETDFGCPGTQYVVYPYMQSNWSKEPENCAENARFCYIKRFILTRLRPRRIISGFFRRMKKNITLAVSDWTGRVYCFCAQ